MREFLKTHTRFTRGLRFRLTITYVLFFTLPLSILGIFFVQTLRSLYEAQMHNILEEEWGGVKGFLRIEKGKINWYYDRDDPEEALIVDRLKQVYLLTDANGVVKERGPHYSRLHIETPDEIKQVLREKGPAWNVKKAEDGQEYLIRSGLFISEDNHPYFVALGRSYAERDRIVHEFARSYFIILPLLIVSASVLGWFMAGRALRPVNDVASAAQRITGANLSAEIPARGSNDELDRLIDAFNQMIERLNAAFRQTRQFSTDVSHELRTPLTAIRGQLEVALMSATTAEQYQEAIVNALEDVERLSKTIRALLLLSQAESGQVVLYKEALNLSLIVQDMVDQFQIPAEASKITLSSELPARCMIEGDRIQLERLVSNLLSNALKYTPEGGSVRVAAAEVPGEVELVVEDTGVGISPDHLPHIFDRFYRVPNMDRDYKTPERGLGLGLSFVAWIVKVHRGRIDVQSQPGAGTRFTVRLPRGNVTLAGHEPSAVVVTMEKS